MGHVKEYTGSDVANFLSKIGFKIDSVVHRNPHAHVSKDVNPLEAIRHRNEKELFVWALKKLSFRFFPLVSVIARRPFE